MRQLRASIALASCILVVTGGPATHAQDQGMLPAGAQFLTAPESLPDGSGAGIDVVAEHDGTVVALAAAPKGDDVLAVVRAPDGTWTTEIVDDGGRNRPPRGFPLAYEGYLPRAIAAGPTGFVAVGTASWRVCPNGACRNGEDATIQSLIWSSPDGRNWQRSDPRSVLGQRSSVVLRAVTALPAGGWMVVGSTAPLDRRKPSRLVVLVSRDGVDWTRTTTIGGSRSLEVLQVQTLGADEVLLTGVELVCNRGSAHHSITAAPYGETVRLNPRRQLRMWRSDSSGERWDKVATAATGVVEGPAVASIKARDCADFSSDTTARISGSGFVAGVVGERVVAMSGDAARAAVTSDLKTWTVGDLPGAIPGDDTADRRRLAAVTVTTDEAGALVLLSVEARRDPAHDDRAMGQGHQVIAWRSADGGATWERLPATRPFLLGPTDGMPPNRAAAQFRPLSDGRMLLLDLAPDGRRTARFGDPGQHRPWGSCDPGPVADCSFATIAVDLPDADLGGIDLTGATVTGSDWSGADLRAASLRSSVIFASLAGADLEGVGAASAYLGGDLTGASLVGADLRGAQLDLAVLASDTSDTQLAGVTWSVPPQLPAGVSLEGRDLTGARFYPSSTEPGDLRGVDFGDSRMDGAQFAGVDLTGAKLKRASFDTLHFFDVTCPDGKPIKASAFGLEACRIKAR